MPTATRSLQRRDQALQVRLVVPGADRGARYGVRGSGRKVMPARAKRAAVVSESGCFQETSVESPRGATSRPVPRRRSAKTAAGPMARWWTAGQPNSASTSWRPVRRSHHAAGKPPAAAPAGRGAVSRDRLHGGLRKRNQRDADGHSRCGVDLHGVHRWRMQRHRRVRGDVGSGPVGDGAVQLDPACAAGDEGRQRLGNGDERAGRDQLRAPTARRTTITARPSP